MSVKFGPRLEPTQYFQSKLQITNIHSSESTTGEPPHTAAKNLRETLKLEFPWSHSKSYLHHLISHPPHSPSSTTSSTPNTHSPKLRVSSPSSKLSAPSWIGLCPSWLVDSEQVSRLTRRSPAKSTASSATSMPGWMLLRPLALPALCQVRIELQFDEFLRFLGFCVVFWIFGNWFVLLNEGGGRDEGDDGKGGKGFREELAALAKEVARLETVRVYAGWLYFIFGGFFFFLSWIIFWIVQMMFLLKYLCSFVC